MDTTYPNMAYAPKPLLTDADQYTVDPVGPLPRSLPEATELPPFLSSVAGIELQFFAPEASEIEQLFHYLEGPMLLRFFAGIGGGSLSLASALSLLNIFTIFSNLPRFVLLIYLTLFGCIIAMIELKSSGVQSCRAWRSLCYRWFPFLAVSGGKGAFYIFTASLGLALGTSSLLVLLSTLLILIVGVGYLVFHHNNGDEIHHKMDRALSTVRISESTGDCYLP